MLLPPSFLFFLLILIIEFLVLKLKLNHKSSIFIIYPLMGAVLLSNFYLFLSSPYIGLIILYFTIRRIINLRRKITDSSSNNYLSKSISSSSTRYILIIIILISIGSLLPFLFLWIAIGIFHIYPLHISGY